MFILIFLVGALLGVVVGGAICIRYLKQEMTARIGPSMELLRLQMDNLQSGVNLALANWHAELHDPRPVPGSRYRPDQVGGADRSRQGD